MMEYLPEIERIASVVSALGAVIIGVLNARKIKEVHISINSRMEQLLKAQSEASEAKGAADERANPLVPKN
jgi:hypothetical protein